jgi:histidinol dehydrogenase
MRIRRFEWSDPPQVAASLRHWFEESASSVDVAPIAAAVRERGDAALRELTARWDATERAAEQIRVSSGEADRALAALDPGLRAAMEVACANIRAVAEAQLRTEPTTVELPQGQRVVLRDVFVRSAGIYVPGGRTAYPSSLLMGVIPASAAQVERIVVATPPGPDGTISPVTLAAFALSGANELYAVGGAQAIFALAYGTESIEPVDVIAGPGNAWVQEAKRAVYGQVGIDSIAGPSELMIIAGHDAEPEWAALDLCAQAEHGPESPLVVTAVEESVLEAIARAAEALSAERPSVHDAPLALVQVPDTMHAIGLATVFAPEHLQVMSEDAARMVGDVRTAGCVFVGRMAATAFGDYAAGSNHVLPTGGAGRFSGPLGPGTFRRQVANVSLPSSAAATLAPHVDALARAEGFPVHGESARARA